ncbi:MAG: glycoside hydrolase family 99-like domain-containing protein [Bauldia sp.]|nr:glycoside hydrolase family 99-like domain-containing protein [Bauldia sp.]
MEFDEDLLNRLLDAGLFDPEWYRRRYRDLPAGTNPSRHFLEVGAREDRWPNAHFDPAWYRASQLSGAWPVHPIAHYLEVGERHGLRPVPYFDPLWYARRYLGPFQDISPLGHYLRGRSSGRLDPCPFFDTQFYIQENADVVASGLDPFEHFLQTGHREGRNPSAAFDLRYYRRRYMKGADGNPLLHYLETGAASGFNPDPAAEVSAGSEVRRFARRAPEFEEFDPAIVGDRERLAKLIAFYLPQFHAFAENDAWWGKGFTEWTNLSRGTPRFVGHYQPRVPRDLGFYDLTDPSVMLAQIAMARAAGLGGFCFYYYNFNGKRLLHAPVEQFLASDSDWPFCIMWANENWSRRWDGSESQILIRQDYRAEDEAALVDDLARHFADPRYIRLGGRPLFFVYRPGIIPRARETIARWREAFQERHGMEPLFFLTQTFEDHDPAAFGFDGAIEFPPHKILAKVHQINPKLEFLDHSFAGHVYRYEDVIEASAAVPTPDFPLIKTVFPSWDNDARRQGNGVVATGSTPAKYGQWLGEAIRYARRHPIAGEALVFINAWNEWAEGAYLEPDVHFGAAYLNATARAIVGGSRAASSGYPFLVVLSSAATAATLAAAQEFIRAAAFDFGCDVNVLWLDRGRNVRDELPFPNSVLVRPDLLPAAVDQFRRRGVAGAVVFGVSAGDAVMPLREAGLRTVSVITEMPMGIAARNEGDLALPLVRLSDVLAAASGSVLSAMTGRFGPAAGKELVVSPGARRIAIGGTKARASASVALGLPRGTRIVVNSGPANLQTGADLFAAVAATVTAVRDDVAFVWFGDLDPSLRAWLDPGGRGSALQFRAAAELQGDPISVAELLAFTAREDANAVAVATAVASSVPVVAFEGSGAAEDYLAGASDRELVARGNVAAFAEEILQRLDRGRGLAGAGASSRPALPGPDFFTLLNEADPSVLPVSIVMLYRRGDPDPAACLAALLAQNRPVAEIVVLGHDISPALRASLVATAERSGRSIRIAEDRLEPRALAYQLGQAAALAVREFVWIVTPAELPRDLLGELSKRFAGPGATASLHALARPEGFSVADQKSTEDPAEAAPSDGGGAGINWVLWRRRALLDALTTLAPGQADSLPAILRHVGARSGEQAPGRTAGTASHSTAAPAPDFPSQTQADVPASTRASAKRRAGGTRGSQVVAPVTTRRRRR